MKNLTKLRQIIRAILHDWWFLALWLLPEFLPPYTSRGYSLSDWGNVNVYIITHPIKSVSAELFPVFQSIPLILLTVLFIFGRQASRFFAAYLAVTNLFFAFLQNISISETLGVAVSTGNLVIFLLLAFFWFREALHPQNRLDIRKDNLWKYWPLFLALLAFWRPLNGQVLQPDFNPLYLFTSGAGLSFCLSTPLYLAVLILAFPIVNKTLLASTAFIGLFMVISNLILEFLIIPAYLWIGVLHFPLVILSAYSLFCIIFDMGNLNHQAG